MSGGVSAAKKEKYRKFQRYSRPLWMDFMFRSRAIRTKRKAIGDKLSENFHIRASNRKDYFPLLYFLSKNKKDDFKKLCEKLELTDAEIKEAALQAKIAELEAQLNSSKQSRKQQTNGNQ